jgi:chemotaxis protein CheC
VGKINLNELDEMQYDVLKEIGNIGAGNATTALSTMLNIKVDMSVPKVALVPFKDIADYIGNEDQTVVGILLEMGADIDGMMMFIFDMRSAHLLVNKLMFDDSEPSEDIAFSEMEESALKEIGNIVAGSYITALSSLTNLTIDASIPMLTIDMIGALLDVPATEFGKYGDKLLFIQSQFGEKDQINGYFLMIPELESYDKILTSLGL